MAAEGKEAAKGEETRKARLRVRVKMVMLKRNLTQEKRVKSKSRI